MEEKLNSISYSYKFINNELFLLNLYVFVIHVEYYEKRQV